MNAFRCYRLKRFPDVAWGDYGDMLIHGMASQSSKGILEVERTGPFIPPISLPYGFVVVTSDFLTCFKKSGLKGYEVYPVTKKRITKVDWHDWAPYGKNEMKYPAGGEPENYILRRKHSPEMAKAIGTLWEIRFQPGISISREGGYHVLADSWTGNDLFTGDGDFNRYHYVTDKAREWLLDNASEWISFEPEKVK